jgi:hypothetical protein
LQLVLSLNQRRREAGGMLSLRSGSKDIYYNIVEEK